ncbi:MAG: hydrogenase maturation nickel metallochaperone HypA [Oscillospiraceae bacterium]|nr:hydrogenase maturation nickel metallochaperone HypA [Oscillospiraceae bacterium]
MHELGVLCQVVKKVSAVAEENGISAIKHITLEVGTESTFVPVFLEKLFPVATDSLSLFKGSALKLLMVPGRNLVIKEIGY